MKYPTLITDNFLSKKEINYIDNTILKYDFPWYYSKDAVSGDGYWFYSHSVIDRIEEGGRHNSYLSSFCISLLNKFCKKNKIKYRKILRCCINTNFAQKNKSFMHIDHECDYNHLLIYLTDNKEGETILFKDNKKTIIKKIKSKQFRAVSFPKCWHVGISPKEGRRVVLVYTFN